MKWAIIAAAIAMLFPMCCLLYYLGEKRDEKPKKEREQEYFSEMVERYEAHVGHKLTDREKALFGKDKKHGAIYMGRIIVGERGELYKLEDK